MRRSGTGDTPYESLQRVIGNTVGTHYLPPLGELDGYPTPQREGECENVESRTEVR